MKIHFILIALALVFFSCKREETKIDISAFTGPVLNLTTIGGWPIIKFKATYTIQVPNDFIGQGINGWEGNAFDKSSNDTTIKLWYHYCSPTFCSDFGDTLSNLELKTINIDDYAGGQFLLDTLIYFNSGSIRVGQLYFSKTNIARGRLYWLDGGMMKQALEMTFPSNNILTIKEIISTIKSNANNQ